MLLSLARKHHVVEYPRIMNEQNQKSMYKILVFSSYNLVFSTLNFCVKIQGQVSDMDSCNKPVCKELQVKCNLLKKEAKTINDHLEKVTATVDVLRKKIQEMESEKYVAMDNLAAAKAEVKVHVYVTIIFFNALTALIVHCIILLRQEI